MRRPLSTSKLASAGWLLFLTLMVFCSCVFAQKGWFWQNPLPQGNTLYDVYMSICLTPTPPLRLARQVQ